MIPQITLEQVKKIGDQVGADWTRIVPEQFQAGLMSEAPGKYFGADNTYESSLLTARIVLSHLEEIPDYYTRLEKMKQKGQRAWRGKKKLQEMKEQFAKSVLMVRDEAAEWRNEMEDFNRAISTCKHQVQEMSSLKLKKKHGRKAQKFEAIWNQELKKVVLLQQKIFMFEKKAEQEFSKSRKKVHAGLLKEKEKLGNLIRRFRKYFEEIKEKFQQFILEVKQSQAKNSPAPLVF